MIKILNGEEITENVLKVKRSEGAKEFKMIGIAKNGDVGMDLPVVLPYKERWKEMVARYVHECNERDEVVDKNFVNELKHGVIVINPDCRYLIPTGIRLEIPEGYWASIEARSSTSKRSLIVPKGIIDEGYRGELFAQVINVGNEKQIIYHGDRLVQLVMHKRIVNSFIIEEVDELSESERGETGFGSSGISAIK